MYTHWLEVQICKCLSLSHWAHRSSSAAVSAPLSRSASPDKKWVKMNISLQQMEIYVCVCACSNMGQRGQNILLTSTFSWKQSILKYIPIKVPLRLSHDTVFPRNPLSLLISISNNSNTPIPIPHIRRGHYNSVINYIPHLILIKYRKQTVPHR